jgi:hypothetical protein
MLVSEVNRHLHACMAAFRGIFLDMDWLRRSRKNETGFEESSFACLAEFCLLLPLSTFYVLYLYALPCHFTCSDSAWAVLNSPEIGVSMLLSGILRCRVSQELWDRE